MNSSTFPAGKRILIVKMGAIGDVVMAIPAAAAMHAAGCAIDWVAGEAAATVLRLYPWIHVIAAEETRLLRAGNRERLGAMLALWRALRRRTAAAPYDLCATLYYDRRYRLLTLPIGAKRRLSLSWQDRATRLLPGRHHTDEYVRILGGRPDGETPTHVAPVPVPNLPPNPHPRTRRSRRARVCLVPAGARNLLRDDALRRWPVESYAALTRALLAAGHEVLLLGGPNDGWAEASFAGLAEAHGPERFTSLIGKLSLPETLAVLDSADVAVTHDTGPLHLAGITGTGIVALFGPTDPHGRLPQRHDAIALWGGETFGCRPCHDGRDYAPCLHNGCIREITPEMVLRAIDVLLNARQDGHPTPPQVLSPADLGSERLRPAPLTAITMPGGTR